MLTVDPSQKKTVIILMVILIGAVCITVARINPSKTEDSGEATEKSRQEASSARSQVAMADRDISRNPFKQPEALRKAELDAKAADEARASSGSDSQVQVYRTGQTPDNGSAQPVDIKLPTLLAQSSAQPAGESGAANTATAKPAFTLLATIKGAEGLSAIIKSGGSKTKIVGVGDILEGGYKVKKLEPDRAVLINGGDTIIVKKPIL